MLGGRAVSLGGESAFWQASQKKPFKKQFAGTTAGPTLPRSFVVGCGPLARMLPVSSTVARYSIADKP